MTTASIQSEDALGFRCEEQIAVEAVSRVVFDLSGSERSDVCA